MNQNGIIKTKEGLIKGEERKNSNNDETYWCFEGIPYAESPIGELRFKAPIPKKPWDGVLLTTKLDEGNICKRFKTIKDEKTGELIQKFVVNGSEDCLKLNVYTKMTENTALKPVMLFIHGGAFTMGDVLDYGVENLMTQDIVLVTIHYRLGALGFLVLDDEISGNAALKDIVLSLKWVQKNIENFFGNPKNVTIFGHSAGGAAVDLLVLSPTTKDLFHKAIIQSGNSISHWSYGNPENGKILAETLGCTENEPKKILQFLQGLPVEKIYQAQLDLGDICEAPKLRYFSPIVEKKNSKEPFLTEKPIEILKTGNFNKIPIMIGYTDMESILFLEMKEDSPFNLNCFGVEKIPSLLLGLDENSNEFKEIVKKIEKFYYGDEKPEHISLATVKMASDNAVIRAAIKLSEYYSKYNPVYLYKINMKVNNGERFNSKGIDGVTHGGELSYLFKKDGKLDLLKGDENLIKERFIKLWTNFARYGNPTPNQDDAILINWKRYEENEKNFLEISENLKLKINPEQESMKFWDEIYQSRPISKDY